MTLIPDVPKIVGKYLREHADVAAVVDRVVAKPPDDTGPPWVQYVEFSAPQDPVSPVDHLVASHLQLDCYASVAGGYREARDIALTVREALTTINKAAHDGAVVTQGRIDDMSHVPDPDLLDDKGKDRQRVILTATVRAHAA